MSKWDPAGGSTLPGVLYGEQAADLTAIVESSPAVRPVQPAPVGSRWTPVLLPTSGSLHSRDKRKHVVITHGAPATAARIAQPNMNRSPEVTV
jgi:hypothetical protein